MIRLVFLLRRAAGMSQPEFAAECETHRRMSDGIPGLIRYQLTLVDSQPDDAQLPPIVLERIDAIGELWTEDQSSLDLLKNSAECARWRAHGDTCIGAMHTLVMSPSPGLTGV